jgi:hypothetical protein
MKVFLTIFACWKKDPEQEPDPDPYLVLTDPDSGGPKTYMDPAPQNCRKLCSNLAISFNKNYQLTQHILATQKNQIGKNAADRATWDVPLSNRGVVAAGEEKRGGDDG